MREAARLGDHDEMIRLIVTEAVELWFTMSPDELSRSISAIPPDKLRANPEAGLLTQMLAPGRGDGPAPDLTSLREMVLPPRVRRWLALMEGVQARLMGDAEAAYQIIIGLPEITDPIPTILDPSYGVRSLFLAQAAMAAALTGRLGEALALFEKMLRVPETHGLEFFPREARLRSAVIHGLWGDPDVAQAHLREARRIPRTESWTEASLDAEQILAESLLADGDRDATFERVLQLSYGAMGEFWPFYLLALLRCGILAERRDEARSRLEALIAGGLGATGSGLPGSLPRALLAFDSLLSGNAPRAKQEWQGADDHAWPVKIIGVMIAARSGAPKTAIRQLNAAQPLTEGLLQAERHRSLVLGVARYLAGDTDVEEATVEYLRGLNQRSGPIDVAVMRILAPRLLVLVAERAPGLLPEGFSLGDDGMHDAPSLTRSELEVLACLARGETRAQIASTLFRSVNTVKTHQRSLYRKLGVTSAGDAVRRAAEFGYL